MENPPVYDSQSRLNTRQARDWHVTEDKFKRTNESQRQIQTHERN